MAYQRFKLQECLATVATFATLGGGTAQTVADVATVAGTSAPNRDALGETVADVATVPRGSTDAAASIPNASAFDVAIAIERAAAGLKCRGYPRDKAWAHARVLVRAEFRNSLALFVPQADLNRCHVCGERERPDFPFIPVLSAKPECPHWLHSGCHAEHIRKVEARVEAAMREVASTGPLSASRGISERRTERVPNLE